MASDLPMNKRREALVDMLDGMHVRPSLVPYYHVEKACGVQDFMVSQELAQQSGEPSRLARPYVFHVLNPENRHEMKLA
eukprot:2451895-Amphidinium_carterae.1